MLDERIRANLDLFYTKDLCEKLYDVYLKNWIADGHIGRELNIFELSMIDEKTPKDFYIDLILEAYSDENKFKKIYETLGEDIKFLFKKILWDREYKINIESNNKYLQKNNFELVPEFSFFKIKQFGTNEAIIYLDYEISVFLRRYIEKPKEYNLYDASSEMQASENLYRDDNEKEFLSNMSEYLEFAKSGFIRISETEKILKDTKRDMLKHCNITEYYGDKKGLDYLKTENIAMFFLLLSEEHKNEKYFNASNIKKIITDFIETKNISKEKNYIYSSLFLNYLKGIKNIWNNKENLAGASASLISLIKEMKEND